MRNLCLTLIFQAIAINLYAQNLVTGIVTDEEQTPLPGVTILEKGTSNGTITDVDGSYKLDVPASATLIIQSVGYETQEIDVNGQSSINVALDEDTQELDAVVVTALGIERETRNLGYSLQRIGTEKVSEIKTANFLDNLSGKLAGVTVTQGATGVGSSSKIVIRGETSFTNNNPLFIVDGTPINNNSVVNFTSDAASGFQEVDFGNGAMEINPDDIESVTVLKGPNSAALYGSRSANGVVLITTKSGKNVKGTETSFNSTTFIDRAFRLPKFQNKYGQGNSGEFEFVDGLGGGTNDNITYSWGPRLDDGVLVPQFDSPVTLADGTVVRGGDLSVHNGEFPIAPTLLRSHPDNLKNFYETGVTTINSIAIRGGFDQGHARLSFTDFRSQSIIPGVDLNRKTVSAKLGIKPSGQLEITSSVNYVNSQSGNRPSNGYGSENINYSLVAWGPRSLDIEALRDYWQPSLENIQQYSFNYSFFDNPYFILHENTNSFERNRIFGNVAARHFIMPSLSIAIRTGLDYSQEQRQFRRHFSTNRFKDGAYAVHDVGYREVNTDLLIHYTTTFGKLGLDLFAGANRMDQQASTLQNQALSLAQPGVFRLSNAASPIQTFDFVSNKRINSVYGLMKAGYSDFLYLDITARNDWYSALATPTSTTNVSALYPSVAASLIVSELFSLPRPINFLKVRASIAEVENDTSPYQTTGVFQSKTPYNGQPTLSDQPTINNRNLKPENKTAVEFGGEIRLFKNRLTVDATYYNEKALQIVTLPISITSGYEEQVLNEGQLRSQGVEILASITPIQKAVNWNLQLNFSRNVTRVESLPEGIDRLTLAYSRIYDNVNQTVFFQVEEGGRLGDMYGTGYLRNENGDFIINSDGEYIADNTLKKLGNYNPDFILGFSNRIAYKQWELNALFDWRKGGKIVSRTLALAAVGGQLEETANRPASGIVAKGVVNLGDADAPMYLPNETAVSAETYYRNFYNRNHEENNTYDASYIKLRELSLTYRFKKGLFQSNDFEISLIGRNLFVITDIPHFDPETLAVQGQNFVNGVEDMSYATTRSYGLKLGLTF